jgi:hypothetical protein
VSEKQRKLEERYGKKQGRKGAGKKAKEGERRKEDSKGVGKKAKEGECRKEGRKGAGKKAKVGEWRKERQESIGKKVKRVAIETRREGNEKGKEEKGERKTRRKRTRKNRKRLDGGGDVPKGNKPECVILFHNGTSLLRNGKMKSLIDSLSPKRMSNTLHFLCYFRLLNGSVVLYVLLMDVIQFILNFKIRIPV